MLRLLALFNGAGGTQYVICRNPPAIAGKFITATRTAYAT